MDRPLVYIAVTNDVYELTVFCGDTSQELAQFLGAADANVVASKLNRAKDGIAIKSGRKYKYMRINPNTGEIYVGKLPKEVRQFLIAEGKNKSQNPYRGRRIMCIKNGTEIHFNSVSEAERITGVPKATIYSAIRTGYRCGGAHWRFA